MPDKALKNAECTEQAIREAAILLISKIGYESMSLRQLATQAGVNPGTLYLYYKGKKELLLTLVLDYLEELSLAWKHCKPRNAKADAALQAFVAFHVRYHLLRKEQGVLGNMELRSLDDGELETVLQARRAYLGELQAILEQGSAEGLFQCDKPKLLSHILFNMLTHVCSWFRPEGTLGIEEVVSQYSELAFRMVGCPQRPRANQLRT